MAKKTQSPLEKTSRLLDLVPYIHAHQGIALNDLADTFRVTTDELTEDLTTLWMCGLPGYTPLELMDLDFDSGYVSIRNAQTLEKPRAISHEEGVALLLGLDLIRSAISPERDDLLAHIDSLRQRISHVVKLPNSLSASPEVNQTIRATIDKSLSEKSGLTIDYHAVYRDAVTSRTIYPLEILQSQGKSYLHGYCYSAKDFRYFRIDRISMASQATVEKPTDVTSHTPEKIPFVVEVLKPSRDAAERFEFSKISEGIQIESTSYSVQWIERAVLASGGSVKIISPSNIRASIAEKAQSILDRYL